MSEMKNIRHKKYNFGPFLIKYWASGSGNTFVGIARIPFKDKMLDWDEGFETIKIYNTESEAEQVILESTKERLRRYAKENNIPLKNSSEESF